MTTVSITCPRCRRTSYNANDVREGYCGFCHEFVQTPLSHPAPTISADPAAPEQQPAPPTEQGGDAP